MLWLREKEGEVSNNMDYIAISGTHTPDVLTLKAFRVGADYIMIKFVVTSLVCYCKDH